MTFGGRQRSDGRFQGTRRRRSAWNWRRCAPVVFLGRSSAPSSLRKPLAATELERRRLATESRRHRSDRKSKNGQGRVEQLANETTTDRNCALADDYDVTWLVLANQSSCFASLTNKSVLSYVFYGVLRFVSMISRTMLRTKRKRARRSFQRGGPVHASPKKRGGSAL